ncbi:MAG: dTMP kinase [Candidatus Heimdallarchaeota archaeon]|nr:dTMP kinase [Candidatus Heimdallarchaeota archaeon]
MSETSSGVFICFEGIDGSGKTTHSRLITGYLRGLGFDAVYTTEPTRYSLPGRKLRESFFAPERLPVEEEFQLFLEDRKIHLKDEVIPQLKDGKTVITDRYYFSSVAYQGSRGLDWQFILDENLKVSIVPNLVLLLDLDVDEAVSRIASEREEGVNTFEKKENLQRVRDIYHKLADKFPDLFHVLNVNKPIQEVQEDIQDFIVNFLSTR